MKRFSSRSDLGVVGAFNAKIGPRRLPEELHIGTHGLEWNEQEAYIPTMDQGIPSSQFHNEIDHIIFNRKYCLTDVSVVLKREGREIQEEEYQNDHNWDLYTSLVSLWEDAVMENVDEQYDRFVNHLHDSAKGAESLKITKRRMSPETFKLIASVEQHECQATTS
ncbi:unnamed protein product [Heligmosomoides polygyrus]|uniref:Cullin domain-containing protein n=1 Tax=Heligmosomoides polygyrus TaxID=6339 RepID=A0A183GBK4_HELPZ|nr:unnamed protein product [Heligmosomoides polygyrus]